MEIEGINATLFQDAFGDADADVTIEPTKAELDALASIEAAIAALDVDSKTKSLLSDRITALLELMKLREQRIFDAGVTLAAESFKNMMEQLDLEDENE